MKTEEARKFLSTKLHVSWHITALSVGILAGTAVAAFIPFSIFHGLHWILTGASIFLIALIKPIRLFVILSVVAGAIVGLSSGSSEMQKLDKYKYFIDEEVYISARIAEDPLVASDGQSRMRIDQVEIESENLSGEIWISTYSQVEIKRGDIITITGSLSDGFGNIPASMYRAELLEVQRPHPGDIGRRSRDWFATQIQNIIPEPEASLGISFLSGHRRAIPENLSEQLRILGLTHLVVASGFHLTIVVRFMRKLFANVSKYLATASSMAMMMGFLLITGFSTSMTRASLVASLSLLAWYYGRKIHPIVLLSFVAAITVLVRPASIWGDIGWFLSFSAFAGVIILAPLINRYFWSDKEPGYFRHLLISTTAAQIATFPIVAYAFGHYSSIALISNLLIMPLVPVAMLLTFLTGGVYALVPALAAPFATITHWLLYYMTSLAEFLARQPWSYSEVNISVLGLTISCILILAIGAFLRIRTGYKLRQANAIE